MTFFANLAIDRRAKRAALAACVSLAVITASTFGAQADALRLIANLEPNDPTVERSLMPFIASVNEMTGGALEIIYNGPDVVPPFEQFQPVQVGAFQLLYTHPVYFNGTTSVGMAVDATDANSELRRSSGFFDALDEHYQTLGMKLIAIPATGTKGYQLIVKDELGDAPSLGGRKIRGNATYSPVIEAFGGTPVVLAAGEIYMSLERGIIDGAAWGASGILNRKWHEVAKYLTRPTFGSNSNVLLMNKAAFDALNPELQGALLAAGRLMEEETPGKMDEFIESEWKALQDLGMKETHFAPSEQEQIQAAFQAGIWEQASVSNAETVVKLRELAVGAGISK